MSSCIAYTGFPTWERKVGGEKNNKGIKYVMSQSAFIGFSCNTYSVVAQLVCRFSKLFLEVH